MFAVKIKGDTGAVARQTAQKVKVAIAKIAIEKM